MSPKIINGSFAAIFDNNDVLFEFAKKLSQFRYGEKDCPGKFILNNFLLFPFLILTDRISLNLSIATQRRIRGMLMSGKQLSLDSRMDLVQRLVTDKSQGDQIDENSEQVINAPSDDEDATEGILTILFISLQKYFKGLLKKYYFI